MHNTTTRAHTHSLNVSYDAGARDRTQCVQLRANVPTYLTHVCYVLGMSYGLDRKASRGLQIICSFLNVDSVVRSISKITANLYKENFCLLEVGLLSVVRKSSVGPAVGPPRPRSRYPTPSHVAFMMSRESVNSSKEKDLDKKLLKMNRTVMFLEDMQAALQRGGGNALAKYLANEVSASQYFAMPPDVKDVRLRCKVIFPEHVNSVGVLRRRMYRGRPLLLKETNATKETDATKAAVKSVSRAEACVSGWVVDF